MLGYKLIIYKILRQIKPPFYPLKFYLSITSFREIGFANFITHCKNLASLIVKEGASATITSLTIKRRESLGLPVLNFNKGDVDKLAVLTGLQKKLGGS